MQAITRFLDKCLIALFMLLIFMPGLGLFIEKNPDEIRTLLNREPYIFPGIDIKRISHTNFKGIENWFADKALFIIPLSKLWSNINFRLGTSTKPGQAVVGKSGWLFLGNDYVATLDQYTGKDTPSQKEMDRMIGAFEHMNQVAKANHIPFLVVVIPDKQDIYPEYLPNYIRKSVSPSRLDRLEKGMKAKHIDFLSLRKDELQAKHTLGKKYGDLYLKGDSHWNYLGAYVAYQSISNYLKRQNLVTRKIAFNFLPMNNNRTDLASFLQLSQVESNSPMPDITHLKIDMWGKGRTGLKQLGVFEGNPNHVILHEPYQNINKALNNQQTCLLIGDSFSESLGFYFHNDFYNTIRIHNTNLTYSLGDLISTYHPNIIVFEIIERDLRNYSNRFAPSL